MSLCPDVSKAQRPLSSRCCLTWRTCRRTSGPRRSPKWINFLFRQNDKYKTFKHQNSKILSYLKAIWKTVIDEWFTLSTCSLRRLLRKAALVSRLSTVETTIATHTFFFLETSSARNRGLKNLYKVVRGHSNKSKCFRPPPSHMSNILTLSRGNPPCGEI